MGTGFESLAHKPRLQAFEYMIDQLGCDPADLLHVSSRLRYDHMSAYDVGIRHTAYIERGHGPSTDYYIRRRVMVSLSLATPSHRARPWLPADPLCQIPP